MFLKKTLPHHQANCFEIDLIKMSSDDCEGSSAESPTKIKQNLAFMGMKILTSRLFV